MVAETLGARWQAAIGRLVLAVLLALLPALAGAAAQDSTLYTVSNVEVDVTDKDASSAKIKAISEAQIKAFRVLIERLGGPSAAEALRGLPAADVGRLMASLSIQSEKSGPGRYIGKLSITFLPDKVRELLAGYDIAYSEDRAPRIVVLPVWQGDEGPTAWEDNPWRLAWLNLNTENDAVPIIVPLGDLSDSEAITAAEALAGDQVKLEAIRIRYEAEAILVAYAEPSGTSGVRAVMSGLTPLGNITFDKVYDAKHGVEASAALAAQRFVAVMNEKWKSGGSGDPADLGRRALVMTVPFSSGAQWTGIRTRLLSLHGVAGIDVTSMSGTGAQVQLVYTTTFPQLQQSLAIVGMKLVEIGGAWVLQPL